MIIERLNAARTEVEKMMAANQAGTERPSQTHFESKLFPIHMGLMKFRMSNYYWKYCANFLIALFVAGTFFDIIVRFEDFENLMW